jgi:GDPmannose 4,6-dehydratase
MGISLEWSESGVNEAGIVAEVQLTELMERFESYHPLRKIKEGQRIISVDPRYFRPTEVETLLGDPTKAHDKLGWKPEISFEGMIEEMIEHDLEETVREVICSRNGFQAPGSIEANM